MDFVPAHFYLRVAWTGMIYSGMSKRSRVALDAIPTSTCPRQQRTRHIPLQRLSGLTTTDRAAVPIFTIHTSLSTTVTGVSVPPQRQSATASSAPSAKYRP